MRRVCFTVHAKPQHLDEYGYRHCHIAVRPEMLEARCAAPTGGHPEKIRAERIDGRDVARSA